MSVAEGQELAGLVVWRVDVRGRVQRVEFLVDGVLRGTDVAAPVHARPGTRTRSSRVSTD